jgi:hypothetical protein
MAGIGRECGIDKPLPLKFPEEVAGLNLRGLTERRGLDLPVKPGKRLIPSGQTCNRMSVLT